MSAEGEQNMKPDEVRAFLTRWVLEFGLEPVMWGRRRDVPWYRELLLNASGVDDDTWAQYFARAHGEDGVYINEAGLQFLKGDDDDNP